MNVISKSLSVRRFEDWHAGFLAVLPAIQTHAGILLRHLPFERRQEAIQEAVASAYVSYLRLAAKGRRDIAHPSTLAAFAVGHVRSGRHVGGSQDPARDVLSRVAHARHDFRTCSYHEYVARGGEWRRFAFTRGQALIPDRVAFRIDFNRWLKSLSGRDHQIVTALMSGERSWAVAERFDLSAGRVSQLRRRYERQWKIFQGETVLESGPVSETEYRYAGHRLRRR